MKTILITGSSGFLGQNLSKLIQEKKFVEYKFLTPTSKQLNLLDYDSVRLYFNEHNIDGIIHGAAICGGLGLNKKRPADLTHLNNKMTVNLFDAIRNYNIKYLICLGTICSYPVFSPVPFKEENIWWGQSEKTNRGYGESKKMLITELQTHMEQYSLSGIVLMPTNIYGMFDHFNDPENNHVIPALITKFIEAKEKNLPNVFCWGDGSATRDFIFCSSVCEAILKALSNGTSSYDPINLGSGQEISIKNLAELIKNITGYEGDIVFTNEVGNGQPRRLLDVSKAKEILAWQLETPLKEGLIKTIEWFQNNRSSIRE